MSLLKCPPLTIESHTCPACGYHGPVVELDCPPASAGRPVRCGECRHRFRVIDDPSPGEATRES